MSGSAEPEQTCDGIAAGFTEDGSGVDVEDGHFVEVAGEGFLTKCVILLQIGWFSFRFLSQLNHIIGDYPISIPLILKFLQINHASADFVDIFLKNRYNSGIHIKEKSDMKTYVDEKVFDFAYSMAFRDATLRKAFPKREGESDKEFHERKQRVKRNSKGTVRQYINEIFSVKQPRPKPYEKICAVCDMGNGFTFGNAQKLVNML